MAISGLTGIITNKNRSGTTDLWQRGIIFLAIFLRVYRFDTLTEFLGDQGRADAFSKRLSAIPGVEVKRMVFDHP